MKFQTFHSVIAPAFRGSVRVKVYTSYVTPFFTTPFSITGQPVCAPLWNSPQSMDVVHHWLVITPPSFTATKSLLAAEGIITRMRM